MSTSTKKSLTTCSHVFDGLRMDIVFGKEVKFCLRCKEYLSLKEYEKWKKERSSPKLSRQSPPLP